MGLDIMGFRQSRFIPWPDDHRDVARFPSEAEQSRAAETQEDLLDYTGGVALIQPSQVLIPEAWNRSGVPPSVWVEQPDDPRTQINKGLVHLPVELLRARLPEALAIAAQQPKPEDRERAKRDLCRIVDTSAALAMAGDALLLMVSA